MTGGTVANKIGKREYARRTAEEPQFLDAPEHPAVIELHAYLERKRGDREMPDRSDIQPSEILKLLPNIIIAEALNGGEDFRTRLFGTGLVELLGEERTGKLLSEFGENGSLSRDPEAVQRRWLNITRQAFLSRKPIFTRIPFSASERLYLVGHAITAPLTAGGTEPMQTIGAMFVVHADRQPGL